MPDFKVVCDTCGTTTRVPFLEELKAEAEENYAMEERSAQDKLLNLHLWLDGVSLFGLLKFWCSRRKDG